MKYDFAGVGLFQTGNDSQNRRLAAARGAQQNQRFTFGNIKGDVFEHTRLAKALADTNHTRGHRRRTPGRIVASLAALMIMACFAFTVTL